MLTYKLWLAFVLPVLGPEPVGRDSAPIQEAEVPRLSDTDRQFLSRVVRRTLHDVSHHGTPYQPDYIPDDLKNAEHEVVVRLREGGFLRSAGAAGPGPVVTATRDATLRAYQIFAGDESMESETLQRFLVEIEVLGQAVPFDVAVDWTKPRAIDDYIEPGVHGLVLIAPGKPRRFCPTDLIASDMVMWDAMENLAKHTLSNPSQIQQTQLLRFCTQHWYEPAPGRPVVLLHRGLTFVPPESVTRERIDKAIQDLAEYMIYRQMPTGLFSYEYLPGQDKYSPDDNIVRQAGAACAMAFHAGKMHSDASAGCADNALRLHLEGLVEIPSIENAAFIATADGQNELGVTALLTAAIAVHPESEEYNEVRDKLVNGIRWLQQPSGMFVTAFPPSERIDAQEYFPGEALLALALHYGKTPSSEILETFSSAFEYYRKFFRDAPSPAFVSWQSQAFAKMAYATKRDDYAEFVFEMTDWLVAKQLDEDNCRWPDLVGGIASYTPERAGVSTASYLEGITDALWLARQRGDHDRAKRYEQAVRRAVRFVLQLQVRPQEAFFMRSPQDAVGGIRTSLAYNALRIDHCQHALVALIKARETLFGAP